MKKIYVDGNVRLKETEKKLWEKIVMDSVKKRLTANFIVTEYCLQKKKKK